MEQAETARGTSRAYAIAFALLMLSVALVFWRHLFTGDVIFFRDISFAHFPRAVELRSVVRQGLLPLWNPFEHFGEPGIVNANYLLFYPTAWLAWVLPAAYGFKLHYILHFFVLAAGSFLLARRIGLSPFACYLAGAVFVFSGPIMSLGNFYNVLPAAAWMPLAILAADYQMRRGGWRGAGLLAAALTLQVFAGEPFTSIATAALALGWNVAFHGAMRERFWAGANRLVFGRFLFSLALVAGLSAVQVFPALSHLRYTERAAQLTYQHTFFWSLHPLKFFEILFPEFWGIPLSDAGLPWLYLEGREAYFLLSVFIGIIPLALALVAALARSDRATRFWLVAGIAALILALGRYTPISYVFYYLIPVFRIVRFPVKFLLPATLAAAQLAALGADYLLSRRARRLEAPAEAIREKRLRWVSGALIALGVAWLAMTAFLLLWPAGARRPIAALAALEFDRARALRIGQSLLMDRAEILKRATDWVAGAIPARVPYVLGAVLLLLVALKEGVREPLRRRIVWVAAIAGVLQLASVHYTLNPVADPRYFRDQPEAMRYLESKQPPLRVFAEPALNPPNRPPAPILIDLGQVSFLPDAAQVLYTYRLSLQSSAGLLGVEGTFTADPEHILLQPQELLNNLVYEYGLSGHPLARLLRMGSVEYALLKRYPEAESLEKVGTASNTTTLPVRVYRVRGTLPRAYLVPIGNATILPTGMPTIHRLLAPDFDPARHLILEQAAREAQAGLASAFSGEAGIVHRDALNVEIAARASAPAYLVLTDSYHPDWTVEVDGAAAPLLRANQIFRAVALAPGPHRVVFRYRPVSLYLGALVTLATAIATLVLSHRGSRVGE